MRYRGRTPLHFLAELTGDPVEIVHFLLRIGVPIDARGLDYRTTALHGACNRGNVRCAAALVAWGADLDAQDRAGLTPLEVAQVEPEIEKRRRENMQAQQAYMESHGLDQKTLRKQAMKRDADGKYAKPPGRVPKGMRWDGDEGEWVPDTRVGLAYPLLYQQGFE